MKKTILTIAILSALSPMGFAAPRTAIEFYAGSGSGLGIAMYDKGIGYGVIGQYSGSSSDNLIVGGPWIEMKQDMGNGVALFEGVGVNIGSGKVGDVAYDSYYGGGVYAGVSKELGLNVLAQAYTNLFWATVSKLSGVQTTEVEIGTVGIGLSYLF